MKFLTRPSFAKSTPGYKPLKGRRLKRRNSMLREASKILPCLPDAGEASHVLMQGQYDLMVLLAAIIDSGGSCQILRIATLSFNDRNVTEMVELLRTGKVSRLQLLCSEYFRDASAAEYARAGEDFGKFPGRATLAAARCHAKVILIDTPHKMVIEGSANLRTNANCEQLAIIRDDALHDWHAGWMDEMVRTGQVREKEEKPGRQTRRRNREAG